LSRERKKRFHQVRSTRGVLGKKENWRANLSEKRSHHQETSWKLELMRKGGGG